MTARGLVMPRLKSDLNTVDDVKSAIAQSKARSEKRRSQRSEWLGKAAEGVSKVTMAEYFAAGINEPWIFDNAHQRIFRELFAEPGILRLNYDTFPNWAKSRGLSQDEEIYLPVGFLDKFYGVDFLLDKYLRFVLGAALGGENERQMLILHGDPGTGKSQIAEVSKSMLTEAVMFRVEGCPINDHPFWLLPISERRVFAAKLGIRIPEDADLCRRCGELLRSDYKGANWDEVKIEAVTVSARRMRGIGVVPPFDPNTMGSEVMIGKDAFWLEYKEEWKRWMYGALGNANGGILEFRELLEAPPEAHHVMYMYTQEKQFPNPTYDGYSTANAMVIAHTNFPKLKQRILGGAYGAFFDRVNSDFARYPLSYRDNIRILEKMLARGFVPRELSEEEREAEEAKRLKIQKSFLVPSPLSLIYDKDVQVHRGVGALAFAAKFKTISHFVSKDDGSEWSTNELGEFLAMHAGETENSEEKIRDHIDKHPTEGLHGYSPRFIIKAVDDALSGALLRWNARAVNGYPPVDLVDNRSEPCADIEDIRQALLRQLFHDLVLAEEVEDKKWQNRVQDQIRMLNGSFIDTAKAELKRTVFNDLLESGLLDKAMGAGVMERAKKEGCERYYKEAKTLLNRQAIGDDKVSGIDMSFLGQIEKLIQENMGQAIGSPDLFREKVVALWEERAQRREYLSPESDVSNLPDYMLQRLAEAVDQYIYNTRSEEFLEKAAEYIKSCATSKRYFKSEILTFLPEYYCCSCFLRALNMSISPLQNMQAQSPVPIK